MELGVNEKSESGKPSEESTGQRSNSSHVILLIWIFLMLPLCFSPPLRLAAPPSFSSSSSGVNVPLPRQHQRSGGSDWLSGKIPAASSCARTGRMSHQHRLRALLHLCVALFPIGFVPPLRNFKMLGADFLPDSSTGTSLIITIHNSWTR